MTALCWCLQDVLEEWLTCQRSWLYLEPIFSSDDISRQLPVEGKRYQTMERTWRKVMKSAYDNKQVRYCNHNTTTHIMLRSTSIRFSVDTECKLNVYCVCAYVHVCV